MSAEAERWREFSDAWHKDLRERGMPEPKPGDKGSLALGDALLAALEARDLEVNSWKQAHAGVLRTLERMERAASDESERVHQLTEALEARDRRIAELEAGLRRVAEACERLQVGYAGTLARDLLAGRAAGGEG